MNMRTLALSPEQYEQIIQAIMTGSDGHRRNERVAAALMLEANIGLRISDILTLKLKQIVRDGTRYRLDGVIEQKTGKARDFTVPTEVYLFLREYCDRHKIQPDQTIFPITERAVQKRLKACCDALGLEGISTHSFRKFFAMGLYEATNCNIVLVQTALQHSSPNITRRYLGVQQKELEQALAGRVNLPGFSKKD